jgi:hypothetical protein
MSMKAPDCWTVPMCVECHSDFDQGKTLTKMERRELMDEMIIQTILKLAAAGAVKA